MTDFTELRKKQRATWALGEYDRIADGLTISTDQTLRVAKIRPGERVLDLATGTGITAIAARERGAKVTAVDLTPELLAVARQKAEDEEEIWELFSTRHGPTVRAAASLDGGSQEALRKDLLSYLGGYRAADGKVRWGREYLITRAVRA